MGESSLPSATSVPTLRDATSHEVFLKCRPAERLRQDLVIGGIGPQSPSTRSKSNARTRRGRA